MTAIHPVTAFPVYNPDLGVVISPAKSSPSWQGKARAILPVSPSPGFEQNLRTYCRWINENFDHCTVVLIDSPAQHERAFCARFGGALVGEESSTFDENLFRILDRHELISAGHILGDDVLDDLSEDRHRLWEGLTSEPFFRDLYIREIESHWQIHSELNRDRIERGARAEEIEFAYLDPANRPHALIAHRNRLLDEILIRYKIWSREKEACLIDTPDLLSTMVGNAMTSMANAQEGTDLSPGEPAPILHISAFPAEDCEAVQESFNDRHRDILGFEWSRGPQSAVL